MSETQLMHKVMVAISAAGYKIFRTNVGKVKLVDGRWFSTGLPKGHADLYGFRPDGQIFYIETKIKPYKPSPEQIHFLEVMRKSGALAGVAYTVEEALAIANGNV